MCIRLIYYILLNKTCKNFATSECVFFFNTEYLFSSRGNAKKDINNIVYYHLPSSKSYLVRNEGYYQCFNFEKVFTAANSVQLRLLATQLSDRGNRDMLSFSCSYFFYLTFIVLHAIRAKNFIATAAEIRRRNKKKYDCNKFIILIVDKKVTCA